jgi:3-hydroxyisobutyrate dehydrogenase-like beta-hydroxyacid dehydrogenase
MSTVAVVGLGAMGSRMARRLLGAGHDVIVWNRTPERVSELASQGARPAESPADAARRSDAVLTMIADAVALRDVTEGPDGVLAGVDGSTTLIQMATVGVPPVLRLAQALSSPEQFLDAPVLGSLAEVESGSLKIFAGGAPSLVRRWTAMLSALGSVLHVGPVGAGSAAKLVANSTLFGALGVLGEALALARALGLPQETAHEVLDVTPIAAQARRRRESVERGEYPLRFALALALKDADLVADAAARSGAELRLASAARSWLADAAEAGLGAEDYSAVLGHLLRSDGRE